MLKKIASLFLSFIVLPITIGAALYFLNRDGYFNLRKIEFNIENTNSQDSASYAPFIQELSKRIEMQKGTSLFSLNMKLIHSEFQNEKWIQSVEVFRQWPDKLKINIKTNKIVLIYWSDKNDIYPILENNQVLNKLDKKLIPDQIITYDKNIFEDPSLREKTINTIKLLPEKGSLNSKAISEIGFEKKEGFWIQLIKKDLKIKLGDENINLKSNRVAQVLDYIDSRQINARVIDANLSQKVLVRLRKDP